MKAYLSKLLDTLAAQIIDWLLDRLSDPIDYLEQKIGDWGKDTDAEDEENTQ